MDNIKKIYDETFESISSKDISVEDRMKSLKSSAKLRANLSIFVKFSVAVFTLVIGFTEFEEIKVLDSDNLKLLMPRALALLSAFLLLADSYLINPNKIAERLSTASNSLYNLLIDRGVLLENFKAQASTRALAGGDINIDPIYIQELINLNKEYSNVFGKINVAFKMKQPADSFAELRIKISE